MFLNNTKYCNKLALFVRAALASMENSNLFILSDLFNFYLWPTLAILFSWRHANNLINIYILMLALHHSDTNLIRQSYLKYI
jgi:hypothetical protein